MKDAKAKMQFDDYWRRTIEMGRKDAAIAEQAQKVSQRSTVGTKSTDDDGRRKVARQGL